MSKFNIQAVVDKSIEERLKHIDLQKDVYNLGKNKMLKIDKKKKHLYSNTPFDENAYEEFKLKEKLFKKMKDQDSYKRHPIHQALFDALDDHDKDPSVAADKHSKNRQKKPDSYKNDKTQARTSKCCNRLEYHLEQCYLAFSDKLDWTNPEGDRIPLDVSKHLPLLSAHGQQYILVEFFFYQDLEYLRTGNLEKRKYTASFTKIKATGYEVYGIKEMIQGL
nr:hypothetical protein [Tanacetum cinerariifolium]